MSNIAQNSDNEPESLSMSLFSLDDSDAPSEIFEETTSESESKEEVDYSTLTVSELKNLCKERGLTNYSSLTKQELIVLLEENG